MGVGTGGLRKRRKGWAVSRTERSAKASQEPLMTRRR